MSADLLSTPRARRRSGPGMSRRTLLRSALGYLLYVLLGLVVLLPLAWVLLGSFKNPSEIFAFPTTFWPRDFTWTNYADVIKRTSLPIYLTNTAIVTLFTMLFTLGFGMLAAYGFSRWDFKLKNVVLVTLLILQLMPSTVNIVPYYLTMDALGLLNTRVALIIIYTATNIPFTIWIGMDTSAYHYAFAASVMSTAPLLVAYLFAQEYLVSGLASGAEK